MKKLLPAIILLVTINTHAQHIATIAGTTAAGYAGDHGPATAAELDGPVGIAADTAGNIYFADRLNHVVRRIDHITSAISTIAGTAVAGYNGDNIAATAAQLNDPFGVATGRDGRIYIADRNNNRIRVVDASGTITTIAGTGTAGFTDNLPATTTMLNNPRGVALDNAGNLYIADQGNNRVRKVTVAGIMTTVAGNGTMGFTDNGPATAARLNGPYAVATDTFGNIFICDVDNERIRKVNTTGIISTIAGTGTSSYNGDGIPATDAQLNEPIGVAVDREGCVYIADSWNQRIRKVLPSGSIITYAGTGMSGMGAENISATSALFFYPYGIAFAPNGDLLIADHGNNRIRHTYAGDVEVTTLNAPDIPISIFPNPSADGKITVALQQPVNGATLRITDINGSVIGKYTITMPVSHYNIAARGVYIVSYITSTASFNKTVIVNK